MKTLNIIETAYRATLEEQDDPILWITHAMKGAGAELAVLLRGNAVNYTVKAQGVAPMAFGGRQQKHGPKLPESVADLIGKGVPVFAVDEDLLDRGLEREELIGGLTVIKKTDLPALLDRHQRVWHW